MTSQLTVPFSVSEPARRRLGIFTTADLSAQGVTEREVRTATRTGAWVRLRPGVFVSAGDLAEVERTQHRTGIHALAVRTVLDRPSAVSAVPPPRGCGASPGRESRRRSSN